MFVSKSKYKAVKDELDRILVGSVVLEELNNDLNDEIKSLIKAHEKESNNLIETLEDQGDKIEVLEANQEAQYELYERELSIELREKTCKIDEEVIEKYVKTVKDLKKEVENQVNLSNDKGYKVGYADGVADGLRKVTEITKEDRDNMAKLAMIVGASHSTDGVQETVAAANFVAKGLSDGKHNK